MSDPIAAYDRQATELAKLYEGLSFEQAHLDTQAAIVRERIAMAGVRLAGLLNRALGAQGPEISLRAELLRRIEAISRELAELRAAVEAIQPK